MNIDLKMVRMDQSELLMILNVVTEFLIDSGRDESAAKHVSIEIAELPGQMSPWESGLPGDMKVTLSLILTDYDKSRKLTERLFKGVVLECGDGVQNQATKTQ